jgi:hypothetical protein
MDRHMHSSQSLEEQNFDHLVLTEFIVDLVTGVLVLSITGVRCVLHGIGDLVTTLILSPAASKLAMQIGAIRHHLPMK